MRKNYKEIEKVKKKLQTYEDLINDEVKRGIYKITNIKNNKCYIGESLDINKRWKVHLDDLNKNQHHSCKLQEDYNKYGKDSFKFEYLELIPHGYTNKYLITLGLIIREDYYIQKYDCIDNGYNIEDTVNEIIYGHKCISKDNQGYEINFMNTYRPLHNPPMCGIASDIEMKFEDILCKNGLTLDGYNNLNT